MKNIKIYEDFAVNGEMYNTEPKDLKAEANKNWPAIESVLRNIKPCKVIKMQDGDTSLNWGLFQGPSGRGGFSISKFGSLNFTTGIELFYNDAVEYMQSKGMEIPKYSGFNEKMGTFHIFTGPDYIWKYSSKDLIDVAKFIAIRVSAR